MGYVCGTRAAYGISAEKNQDAGSVELQDGRELRKDSRMARVIQNSFREGYAREVADRTNGSESRKGLWQEEEIATPFGKTAVPRRETYA